jgi:hypothetical protein
MASYYDRVLEDFEIRESESGYGFDEGILDEGIYDESSYDEAIFSKKQRPVRLPGSVGKPANFGKNMVSANGSYVTKSELKSSLNSISEQVNDLKKTGITLASSIKRLDDGYEKIVKSIAKKDKAQDNILSGTTMMSLLSTIANKPALDPTALKVVRDGEGSASSHIELVPGKDAIQQDLTKTLLFTMLPTMAGSGNSDNNMMMMLMMVLALGQQGGTSNNSNNNTLLLMLPMMMMMNKK